MPDGLQTDDHMLTTVEALEAHYGTPLDRSIWKEQDHLTEHYRALVEASPFAILATAGPEGLDCSPRGDPTGFVSVLDPKTVAIPDRPGNNRVDSLKNIVRDPRIALLFLMPGIGYTMRINGRARISIDPELLARFPVHGKSPRAVILVTVESAYFQCPKAVVRAKLWEPESRVDPASLPTMGEMLAFYAPQPVDAEKFDREYPEHMKKVMY